MRAVRGKELYEIDADEFAGLLQSPRDALIDVGTGDGIFVYRYALAHANTLCIGLDPVAENMARVSSKLARRPSRGGISNMLFVVASLEAPPALLLHVASRITVHFPWASMLRGLVAPDPDWISNLVRLAARPCRVSMLLNASLFEKRPQRERLDLPEVTLDYVDQVLAPAYSRQGLVIRERDMMGSGPLPVRTTWGQHLSLNSRRKTLALEMDVL